MVQDPRFVIPEINIPVIPEMPVIPEGIGDLAKVIEMKDIPGVDTDAIMKEKLKKVKLKGN